MTYERINFVNQSVERPRTYEMTHNSDGSVTLVDSFGLVDELGTPINADTMNHIEDGIVGNEERITRLEEQTDTSQFLNTTQITNCLLEVPQNIKLELVDGELTLKAGSKVIVPNGVGVFNEVTIKSDVSCTISSTGTKTCLLFYRLTSNSLNCYWNITDVFSGTTQPTQSTYMYYNTNANKIRYTLSGTTYNNEEVSFPVAQISIVNGVCTSIDHIFNGFGVIGSCWWVDKDVEALISKSYNDDGTINNLVVKTTRVSISNQPASARLIILNEQGNLESIVRVNYIESEETPSYTGTSSNLWYNPKTLEWKTYDATLDKWHEKPALPIAWDIKNGSGQITDFGFIREKTFRAMDYNEANEAFAKPYIGQIIQATVSADYVPEGTLPCDGAEYSESQFSELYSNWLVTKKLKTCTYTEYSNMISTYGQCSMWALDTTNRKFKVPLIKDGAVIQQALSDTEIGKAYNAGLPNIEGTVPTFTLWGTGTATGAFALNTPSGGSVGGTGAPWYVYTATMDASKSSSIYGNSDTVQMNAVAVRFFVVVATGSINQSQMDWSAWASSLANKANVDLSNAEPSQGFIDKSIGWGMPDYSAGIDVTFPFTAPSNGVISLSAYKANTGTHYFYINGNTIAGQQNNANSYYTNIGGEFLLNQGDILSADSIWGITIAKFFPLKGVN